MEAVPTSDERLLDRFCRTGDRSAMEELVMRHQGEAYRLAWRMLGNESDAGDAVQEAVLRVMRSARSFRGEGSVAGWIRRAVASAALDLARRKERRARRESRAAEVGGDANMLNPVEKTEALAALQVELAELPAEMRAAVVLRHAETMSDAQAAAALGWPRRTFSARASAALERLKERFRRRGLAGAALLVPALLGEIPAPVAPAALAGTLRSIVAAGPLATPFWLAALIAGGKAMIAKPGLVSAVVLSMALAGGAAAFRPESRALAGAPVTAPDPAGAAAAPVKVEPKEDVATKVTQGTLRVLQEDGTYAECPLKHTDVTATISGFIARATVKQTFVNPTDKKIEAVYVFPLPHKSAVDSMNMLVGGRKIVGLIKRREVAEQIYQAALRAGITAAVLHQERPNVFTQKVGNIPPKGKVEIEISFVDVLEYDCGTYTFHFPMVVGPRYNPAGWTKGVGAVPAGAPGTSGQTVEVPYTTRSGHDISLSVKLDAGVPIQDLKSVNHKTLIERDGVTGAVCAIAQGDQIPNKDFELRYSVAGKKPEMALLAHQDSGRDGYFMLMMQPAQDERLLKAPPREITFLVDVSGSMNGAPTAQVKLALKYFLQQVRPIDRIQLITFAGTPYNVFEKPLPATKENIKKLADYGSKYQAGGGTEMLPAVQKALGEKLEGDMVRIVVMLSDGYIGNEEQIISEVGKKCGDQIRFWCLGIGTSVNRMLVDGVAKQGGGMSKVLSINEKEEEVAKLVGEIMYRIQRAQLANISINWANLNVYETYPARVPELWAGRPVIVYGRYTGGEEARIHISGDAEGRPVSFPLDVKLPKKEPKNDVLATVWARQKIESLMEQVWVDGSPAMVEEVTKIALEHKLMSQYTSFVAVDTESAPKAGEPVEPPVRIPVPVPMPQGVGWAGVFGGEVAVEEAREALELLDTDEDQGKRGGRWDRFPSADAPASGPMPTKTPPAGRDMTRFGITKGDAGFVYHPGGAIMTERDQGRIAEPQKLVLVAGKTEEQNFKNLSELRRRTLDGKDVIGDIPLGGDYGIMSYAGRRSLLYDGRALNAFKLVPARDEKTAKALVEKAGTLLAAAGKAEGAAKCALLQRAWLYDTALAAAGLSSGEAAEKALAELESARAKLTEERLAAEPKLKRRIEKLVLRNRQLDEALKDVAAAAGLKLNLVPGAIEAACRLQGVKSLPVVYMDLSGASAAQAIEWLCAPVHLDWSVSRGRVEVSAALLGSTPAPWTYDVAALAIPEAKEFEKLTDGAKISERTDALAAEFLGALGKAAGASRPEDCFWLAPGQAVVFADAAAHARVVKLLDELRNGKGDHGELGKRAAERWAARKESIKQADEARENGEVYGAINWSSWRLLSGAAGLELDLEALTRLQWAWLKPFAAKLSADKRPLSALRSAWAITESARALPRERELKSLAGEVLGRTAQSADAALAALEESPNDPAAWAAALYAVMSVRNGQALGVVEAARAESLSSRLATMATGAAAKDATAAAMQLMSRILVSGAAKGDGEKLAKLLESGLGGNDLNVLAALAARKLGEGAWNTFRTGAQEHFGQSGVSGDVVIICNRMCKNGLPSTR